MIFLMLNSWLFWKKGEEVTNSNEAQLTLLCLVYCFMDKKQNTTMILFTDGRTVISFLLNTSVA